jgi:dethiobiotin synthetase
MMARGFFVTGTDTAVGKTLVSAALVSSFAGQGLRAVGMKPIASGCIRENGVLLNEDVEILRAASNVDLPREWVSPYAFEPAVAPHIAAQQSSVRIDIDLLRRRYLELASLADVVVVEGVGGFMVPINREQTTADLAEGLGLPVLLVVGMRLGCLNHALLTSSAIAAKGLSLVGWVANQVDPAMSCFEENLAELTRLIAAPLIGCIPPLTGKPNPISTQRFLRVRTEDFRIYGNQNILK